MKKYFLVLLFIASYLIAQTEQQGIELPDFVITGRQNVDLPTAVKKKPDFISTISKDFLTPRYSPEELPLLFSSEPMPVLPSIINIDNIFNGTLRLQAGKYSLPIGNLSINQSFNNYLFNASVWGSNNLEFIPNSGYNNSGVSLSNEFFFSTKSDFLPGAKIKLAADYYRDSYHLYASKDPTFLRETNNGSAIFSVESSYNRWINFSLGLTGNIFSLSESGLKETNLKANGLLELKLNSITFTAKGNFVKQYLVNNLSGTDQSNFYSVKSYFTIYPANFFYFTIGAEYSSNTTSNFLSPFGIFNFKLDKGLTFSVGFNPHSQFLSTTDLLKKNLYYNLGLIDNVFSRYKFNLNGKLKYEYEKIFSVTLSSDFSKVEDYFYFDDVVDNGKFDLYMLPESKIFSTSVDLIFNPAYYGYFFGSIEFKDAKDNLDNNVPYEPKISANLSYGYDFKNSFGFDIKYKLAFDIYTDITNSNKLNDYHNISLSFYYELLKGLKLTADFQNILNRINFVWKQYQEKPFDVLLGVEYRW